MKTDLTDIDREAVRLFKPAGGMRVGWRYTSVTTVAPAVRYTWERLRDGSEATPDALDTDDPATVGCMLAQVESARPGQSVTVVDRLHSLPGDAERRFLALVEHDGSETAATGPTRGAALVAAMRALR